MEKIIFLDIDGVLNPTHFSNALFKMWKSSDCVIKSQDEYGYLFFDQNCEALANIINKTGAKIVISSEWRKMGKERISEMWDYRNLPGIIIDVTPTESEFLSENKEYDFLDLIGRGELINYWIRKNNYGGNFVIIDDVFDFLGEQEPFVVKTNALYGLTDMDAEKAIKILNREI